jgi:hypothetical protein
MNKQVLASYLRHLITTAFGAAVVVVNVKHVGIAHLTKADVLAVANAAWIAILPQLRFGAKAFAEPLIDAYLKKQYPALGIVLADLENFNTQAVEQTATPAPTPPTVVPGA